MKIKIDERGHLWIERAGKFKLQGCPHDNDGAKCGDWCPKFMEPGADNDHLHICGGIVLMPSGEIVDERQKRRIG